MAMQQFAGIISALVFFCVSWSCAEAQQSVLKRHPLTAEFSTQWKLPGRLNEISGLALAPDGRLFAVNDERAAIYELDYDDGRLIKVFAFGDPVERGDFEGIAYLDNRLWLTTSSGVIYAGQEGADGEQVAFRRWSTNLGKQCEIEGLAQDVEKDTLLLICKHLKKKSDLEVLSVFSWSVRDERLVEKDTVSLPVAEILKSLRTDRFNPSGIAVVAPDGRLLIVASRQRALVEVTAAGEFIAARALPSGKRHRQAEGIEVTEDAELLVADEGGSHRARLALYWPEEGG